MVPEHHCPFLLATKSLVYCWQAIAPGPAFFACKMEDCARWPFRTILDTLTQSFPIVFPSSGFLTFLCSTVLMMLSFSLNWFTLTYLSPSKVVIALNSWVWCAGWSEIIKKNSARYHLTFYLMPPFGKHCIKSLLSRQPAERTGNQWKVSAQVRVSLSRTRNRTLVLV